MAIDEARRRLLLGSLSGPPLGPLLSPLLSRFLACGLPVAAPSAIASSSPSGLRSLDPAQSRAFRQWFVAIVEHQVLLAPSPRWVHRDCAGLVRFAAAESFRSHDERWMHAIGWDRRRPSPPEIGLADDQRGWSGAWELPDGRRAPFASALAIVQNNARPVGRDRSAALPGDLLFFDQGDDQHLMIWTGSRIAYHTGAEPVAGDNGLRQLRWESLLRWPDTRWRPTPANANFAGLYRFAFLT